MFGFSLLFLKFDFWNFYEFWSLNFEVFTQKAEFWSLSFTKKVY